MDEISNKTLATLLVVAIVISLAGTFFAMRGVSQVTNIISGAVISGTANVNITETIEIDVTQFTVDFGAGTRNGTIESDIGCNLSTIDNVTYSARPAGFTGVPPCWDNSTNYNPEAFVIENKGTTLVKVEINSSIADNFIGVGGSPAVYGFKGISAEAGCTTGWLASNFTDFTGADQMLCTNLSNAAAGDELIIDINVTIPSGPAGNKTTSVTFTAAKV
ncbi:MAG: hypothetical protein ABIA62_04105 [Candidatus Woesearchaeota archaeon]